MQSFDSRPLLNVSLSGAQRTLERHRLVNDAVSEEFKNGLHALIIKAKTPEEISKAAASS